MGTVEHLAWNSAFALSSSAALASESRFTDTVEDLPVPAFSRRSVSPSDRSVSMRWARVAHAGSTFPAAAVPLGEVAMDCVVRFVPSNWLVDEHPESSKAPPIARASVADVDCMVSPVSHARQRAWPCVLLV